MEHNFRIAPGLEDMPPGFQDRAQIQEIVELAIEHDTAAVRLIEDRLAPPCKIDNA
jgi:hypothetical protein